MLEPGIKITKINEDARFDERGEMYATIRVEFRVGTHGPFVERFPKADYSADKRDDVLNTFAREVRTS